MYHALSSWISRGGAGMHRVVRPYPTKRKAVGSLVRDLVMLAYLADRSTVILSGDYDATDDVPALVCYGFSKVASQDSCRCIGSTLRGKHR